MKKASLTVVGTGIKFIAHLTVETKAYIEQADKVLYLVNDPATKNWIEECNVSSESLEGLYRKYPLRSDCYDAISTYILEVLRLQQHVCVVLYGHPTVFAQPALGAVIAAKKEGYDARILPGISAEDCLFSDLLINPGSCGCQSFEASDFLIYKRQFDIFSHLILWQVGTIGLLQHPIHHDNARGAKFLGNYLSQYYPISHEVIIYEAAQYPGFAPSIQNTSLEKLSYAKYSSLSTLYVPPYGKKEADQTILADLKVNKK